MIPGHIYLSAVVPPFEKWPFVIAGMTAAMVIGYLLVKGILAYDRWRYNSRTGEVVIKGGRQ